jgi:uncharacterized small protein (DUF1192 family)
MSDQPPDLGALAKRYLDLWQEQVASVAADPALAEVMARGLAMMTQSAQAVAQATGLDRAKAAQQPDKHDGSNPANRSQRPAAAAAASDDPRLDHDQLAGRVAALEERVARLEAALGAKGATVAPKPGRSRPNGA